VEILQARHHRHLESRVNKLYKYDCGCIGIPLGGNQVLCFVCCDSVDDYFTAIIRTIQHLEIGITGVYNKGEQLSEEETKELIQGMQSQLVDGINFKTIQRLLKWQ
jgi:hypothetical protein